MSKSKAPPPLRGLFNAEPGAQVIYVGKAVNIKRRLQGYFRPPSEASPEVDKLAALVPRVASISLRQTGSELEARLIKQYRPAFNQKIKHYERQVYLKISYGGLYPRISIERNYETDSETAYFVPFSGQGSLESMLDTVNQVFPLRTCDLTQLLTHADHPCRRYEEGLCGAPCGERISREEYVSLLEDFTACLQGRPSWRMTELWAREALSETAIDPNGIAERVSPAGPGVAFTGGLPKEEWMDKEPEDLLTRLSRYTPTNYHENHCMIVLPDLGGGML